MIEMKSPFNTPIETGLRCLILLSAGYPSAYDINRLVFYDYFLVHSGDVGGPKSIHPNTPHRSGEILIRRPLLEAGLKIMAARGLIQIYYSSDGVTYAASENCAPFLDILQAEYTRKLINTAMWVTKNFDRLDIDQLKQNVNKNLPVWGGEFLTESIIRGEQML